MRDRLVEMLQKRSCFYNKCKGNCCKCDYVPIADVDFDNLADYLLANGVIVPPCKFLQRVYVIPTIENRLSDVTEMKCIGFTLSHDAYCVNLMNEKNKLYQPAFGRFGKTVFLTREEAERALKGGD